MLLRKIIGRGGRPTVPMANTFSANIIMNSLPISCHLASSSSLRMAWPRSSISLATPTGSSPDSPLDWYQLRHSGAQWPAVRNQPLAGLSVRYFNWLGSMIQVVRS